MKKIKQQPIKIKQQPIKIKQQPIKKSQIQNKNKRIIKNTNTIGRQIIILHKSKTTKSNITKFMKLFKKHIKQQQFIRLVNNLINNIRNDLDYETLNHIWYKLDKLADIYLNNYNYFISKDTHEVFDSLIKNSKRIIVLQDKIYYKNYIDKVIRLIQDVDAKYLDIRFDIYNTQLVNKFNQIPYGDSIPYIELCTNAQLIQLATLLK